MSNNKEYDNWLDKLAAEIRKVNKPDDIIVFRGKQITRAEFLQIAKNEMKPEDFIDENTVS